MIAYSQKEFAIAKVQSIKQHCPLSGQNEKFECKDIKTHREKSVAD